MVEEAARVSCPKCGTSRHVDSDCAKCGLTNAHARTYVREQAEPEAPEVVRAAWETVLADWDNEKRHDALLQLVSTHGSYAWAASRYRAEATKRTDDVVAPRELDRIRKSTEAQLRTTATVRSDGKPMPFRATILLLVFFVAIVGVGLVYVMVRGETPKPRPATGTIAPPTQTR